jgi:Domain of unknown function (DUF5680)
MTSVSLDELNAFIVRAKANTYVGGAAKSPSCRPGSHDIQFHAGAFSYIDSYFGGSDFLGQEVVYFQQQPVWAMNYYGKIIHPHLISAAQAGQIIQASLSQMYKQGRFLGGFEYTVGESIYTDTSEGTIASFTGQEWITRQDQRVYHLIYHGGLVKD